MTILRALGTGLAETFGAKRLWAGLWLLHLLVVLPAGAALTSSIAKSIEGTAVEERLRRGFDLVWYGEYAAGERGFETTFRPELSGAGAMFDTLERWLTGELFRLPPLLLTTGLLWALAWTFLLGGVLERFARPVSLRGAGRFARDCARHFPPLLRLALLGAPLYIALYRAHAWFGERLGFWLRDVTSETQSLLWTVAWYAAFVALVTAVHVVLAYAKIALVAGRDRGALRAALRGLHFVVRHPLRAFGLYALPATAGMLLLAAWSFVAPGAAPSSWLAVLAAFAVAQLYLAAQLGLRLVLWSAQTALYDELAPIGSPAP